MNEQAGFWGDTVLSALDQMASPNHTPTVSYFSGWESSQLSSPVTYRPAIAGTGSRVRDWNGQNDPNFVFHPGLFETANGANNDLAVQGVFKPGGQPQSARWPMIVEFNTSSGVDRVEVAFFSSENIQFGLEVNGLRSVSPYAIEGPTNLGNGKRFLLTFPDARARRIRLYLSGGSGFQSVRVPAGQSISKPSDGIRAGVFFGDSYVNGSGGVNDYPSGAGLFDTFALRTLKALGCNRFILAGIGGTGFISGGTERSYSTRVSAVLAMSPAPDVMLVNGSINDGGTAGGIQAAAESFLSDTASMPERYVVGTMKSGYDGNHDAVEAAAASAGVPFVPMKRFFLGTGNVTAPNGTGNSDLYMRGDGVHPTLPGHTAAAARVISQVTRLQN